MDQVVEITGRQLFCPTAVALSREDQWVAVLEQSGTGGPIAGDVSLRLMKGQKSVETVQESLGPDKVEVIDSPCGGRAKP